MRKLKRVFSESLVLKCPHYITIVLTHPPLQMLQLWRIRQPHSGQMHDGPPAEEMPQLQERPAPHRRLPDQNRTSGEQPERQTERRQAGRGDGGRNLGVRRGDHCRHHRVSRQDTTGISPGGCSRGGRLGYRPTGCVALFLFCKYFSIFLNYAHYDI